MIEQSSVQYTMSSKHYNALKLTGTLQFRIQVHEQKAPAMASTDSHLSCMGTMHGAEEGYG